MVDPATPPSASSAQAVSFRYRIVTDDQVSSAAERGLLLFKQGRLDRAIPLLRQGAADGERRAQYVLATALFNGDHVERDVVAAFRWMRLACDAGLSQAADSLAEMIRLEPAHADTPSHESAGLPGEKGDTLLSPATLSACRRLIAERFASAGTARAASLEAMVEGMVVTELRARLDTLVTEALARRLVAR